MTTAQLRKQAKERLDCLPPDKVRVAAEFLDYLDTAASRDATAELLRDAGVASGRERGSRAYQERAEQGWRKVRKDV